MTLWPRGVSITSGGRTVVKLTYPDPEESGPFLEAQQHEGASLRMLAALLIVTGVSIIAGLVITFVH